METSLKRANKGRGRGIFDWRIGKLEERANMDWRPSNFDKSLPRPTPTNDMDKLKHDLKNFGYCLIKDALSPETVKRVKKRLVEQAEGEALAGVASYDGGKKNQRIYHLLNKDDDNLFHDMCLQPQVDELMKEMLGDDWILFNYTANIAGQGGTPQFIHQDQGFLSKVLPIPVIGNAIFMIDDFKMENGGTHIIPGSHLVIKDGFSISELQDEISAEGPAGTCIVFDGRLAHGTGKNITSDRRHAVILTTCLPWIRNSENYIVSTAPDVLEKAHPYVKKLLGLKPYETLGSIEGVRHHNFKPFLEKPDVCVRKLTPNSSQEELQKNYTRRSYM